MFVDEVVVEVQAGNGGNGCMAFRREKFIAMGGPYGGNGGRGSSIIFEVDEGLNTLIDLRYQKKIKGSNGTNGSGKGKHGKSADDKIIKVPPGTVLIDVDTNLILADLVEKDEQFVVAKGGRGGRGNMAFATSANPAPSIAENGEPGEVRKIKLELKLLADVGLVGLPSVGKSTIISKISAAKPKIADYHFTTLSPNLGVVKTLDNRSFVVADLPGLIEGASLGQGLGDQFLKHIERTRVIAHIIDMGAVEGRNPIDDYNTINSELERFNPKIMQKPQLIIANKMDVYGALENLTEFKKSVNLPVYEISALTGKGLDAVLIELANMLNEIEKTPLYEDEKFESHVLYKFKEEKPFEIYNEDGIWIIKGEEIEKLVKMTRFNTDDEIRRFNHKLKKLGIEEKLRELGAEEGDDIQILDLNFEYKI